MANNNMYKDKDDHVEFKKTELKNTQTSRYRAKQHESFNYLDTTGQD